MNKFPTPYVGEKVYYHYDAVVIDCIVTGVTKPSLVHAKRLTARLTRIGIHDSKPFMALHESVKGDEGEPFWSRSPNPAYSGEVPVKDFMEVMVGDNVNIIWTDGQATEVARVTKVYDDKAIRVHLIDPMSNTGYDCTASHVSNARDASRVWAFSNETVPEEASGSTLAPANHPKESSGAARFGVVEKRLPKVGDMVAVYTHKKHFSTFVTWTDKLIIKVDMDYLGKGVNLKHVYHKGFYRDKNDLGNWDEPGDYAYWYYIEDGDAVETEPHPYVTHDQVVPFKDAKDVKIGDNVNITWSDGKRGPVVARVLDYYEGMPVPSIRVELTNKVTGEKVEHTVSHVSLSDVDDSPLSWSFTKKESLSYDAQPEKLPSAQVGDNVCVSIFGKEFCGVVSWANDTSVITADCEHLTPDLHVVHRDHFKEDELLSKVYWYEPEVPKKNPNDVAVGDFVNVTWFNDNPDVIARVEYVYEGATAIPSIKVMLVDSETKKSFSATVSHKSRPGAVLYWTFDEPSEVEPTGKRLPKVGDAVYVSIRGRRVDWLKVGRVDGTQIRVYGIALDDELKEVSIFPREYFTEDEYHNNIYWYFDDAIDVTENARAPVVGDKVCVSIRNRVVRGKVQRVDAMRIRLESDDVALIGRDVHPQQYYAPETLSKHVYWYYDESLEPELKECPQGVVGDIVRVYDNGATFSGLVRWANDVSVIKVFAEGFDSEFAIAHREYYQKVDREASISWYEADERYKRKPLIGDKVFVGLDGEVYSGKVSYADNFTIRITSGNLSHKVKERYFKYREFLAKNAHSHSRGCWHFDAEMLPTVETRRPVNGDKVCVSICGRIVRGVVARVEGYGIRISEDLDSLRGIDIKPEEFFEAGIRRKRIYWYYDESIEPMDEAEEVVPEVNLTERAPVQGDFVSVFMKGLTYKAAVTMADGHVIMVTGNNLDKELHGRRIEHKDFYDGEDDLSERVYWYFNDPSLRNYMFSAEERARLDYIDRAAELLGNAVFVLQTERDEIRKKYPNTIYKVPPHKELTEAQRLSFHAVLDAIVKSEE